MKVFKYVLKVSVNGSEESLQGILGSQASREVAAEYILAKAKDRGYTGKDLPADEVEALSPEAKMEKKTTVFHKVNGTPVMFDYQFKGFFKEAANALKDQIKWTWPASRVTQGLFVRPRIIPLKRPDGKLITKEEIDRFERPLRAMTMQGQRVGLAVSEWIKPPIMLECELHLVGDKLDEESLRMILDYGAYIGLGQFRSGGFGNFEYELTPLQKEKPQPSEKVKRGKQATEAALTAASALVTEEENGVPA